MAFQDNDISNHPLLMALAEEGLLDGDGTMFVQGGTGRTPSGTMSPDDRARLYSERNKAEALSKGQFPEPQQPRREGPDVIVSGFSKRPTFEQAAGQAEAARQRLEGKYHLEGGPFSRVLHRWGITPESSYGEASSAVWDAFVKSNRGDVGSGFTREDLGELRRYLVTRRMAENPADPWATERLSGEQPRGFTTRSTDPFELRGEMQPGQLPGHSFRGGPFGGNQKARQQAEWDLMQAIMGEWDPDVNQPVGWGGSQGIRGMKFNPLLHGKNPDGPVGAMDEFLRLQGISGPRYMSPADLNYPLAPQRGRHHDIDWIGPGM